MTDDARVLSLLENLMESGESPEVACSDCPELLPSIMEQWEQCRRLDARIDALFSVHDDDSPSTPSDDRLPRIAGYEVLAVAGRGGMGVVYRARHLKLNRIIALKTLSNGMYASVIERARFLREAQAVASLRHPNIVQVFDVGEFEGRPFFTMEFVGGSTLAQKLSGVPQPSRDATATMVILADAIQSAHQSGIVHRDLKPSNVLLTGDGSLKISDFGLARRIESADDLTLSGSRLGTPSYMAPEQASSRCGSVGPATDVYALGAILYEMLTGRPPFQGESPADTERQLLSDDPVPPSKLNSRVCRDLQTICLTCLQKDPKRRYPTAAALAEDLRCLQRGEPISARRSGPAERLVKTMRRHPSITTAAVFALLITASVFAAAIWFVSQRNTNSKIVGEQLREAFRFQQQGAWKDADVALGRATLQLGTGGPADLHKQLEQARRASELAAILDRICLDHSGSINGVSNHLTADVAYRKTFSDFAIGTVNDPPQRVAVRIRSSSIHTAIVAAMYDWTMCPQMADRAWLEEVIDLSEDDQTGWRARVRDPSVWNNGDALETCSVNAPFETESVPLLLSVGKQLEHCGKDPLAFLKQVQFVHPDDFWANEALGDQLNSQQKPGDAIPFYQAAVAIRPSAPQAHNCLGLVLGLTEHFDQAIKEFQEGLRLDPNAFPCRANLGIIMQKAGRYDEAIDALTRCVAQDPRNGQLLCYLGASLEAVDKTRDALRAYENCVKFNPKYELGHKKLHSLLIREGRDDEALDAWQAELKEIPTQTNAWEGYPEFCLHLNRRGEYEKARDEQLQIFAGSQDPIVCERVGRTCLLLPSTPEMLKQAKERIDHAVEQSKKSSLYSYFLFSRGLAEYRAGDFAQAITSISSASSLSYRPARRFVQAMAEYRLGDVDLAHALYAQAVASCDWNQPHTDDHQFWMYQLLRNEADALIHTK